MDSNFTIKEQIRRNLVALISLAVAVTGLGYNTWRNEASEHNRNQRLVSIELLLMLADVQQLTQEAQWGNNEDRAPILREIWSKILTIEDLSQISEGSVPVSATALYKIWSEDYDKLGLGEQRKKESIRAKDRIVSALEDGRSDTQAGLTSIN